MKHLSILALVLTALFFSTASAQNVSVSVSWNDIIGRNPHHSDAIIIETTPSRVHTVPVHRPAVRAYSLPAHRPSVRVYSVPSPRPSVRVYTVPTHRPGVRVYSVPSRSYTPSRPGVSFNLNFNTGRWHY